MRAKLILLAFLCFVSTFLQAQTEALDILSFTPPAGYGRQQDKTSVEFSRTINDGANYCKITVFASRPATDDISKEFTNEWDEHAANGRTVAAQPDPQTSPPNDGWNIVFGSAPAKSDAGKYVVSLMTIIGHKRATSILILTNTEEFNGDLETFLGSVFPNTSVADQEAAVQK